MKQPLKLLIGVGISCITMSLSIIVLVISLSDGDVDKIFAAHLEDFIAISELIDELPQMHIARRDDKNEKISDEKCLYVSDMKITTHNNTLSSGEKKLIEQSSLHEIFSIYRFGKPYFDEVLIKNNYILFRINSLFSISGIIFLPNGDTDDFFITDKKELMSDWYYIIYR